MRKRMEMKKEYFIEQNGKKEGAFTLEELKQKDIYDSALIWKAGWSDWKKAVDVEEITAYVIITPPPTSVERIRLEKDEKINDFKQNVKANSPMFFIGFIMCSLAWHFLFIAIAQDGGSDLFPIYLSYEEQRDSSLIFWNYLPTNVALVGFISLIALLVYSYFNNVENVDEGIITPVKEWKYEKKGLYNVVIAAIIFLLLFVLFSVFSS